MYSRRHRRPRSVNGASSLRDVYVSILDGDEHSLHECMGDSHNMLSWLIRCAQLRSSPRRCCIPSKVHLRSNLADMVENINALREPMCVDELDALESQVAVWVMRETLPMHVLTYLSWFFYRYRVYCHINALDDMPGSSTEIGWLTISSVERALVIPDVRKLAFTLFCMSELRSGEKEWGNSMGTLSVCSVDNVLQVFRTSEYMGSARGTLTYGSATAIKTHGLLPYVVLAMVDIRLRSRAQLPWVDKCVRFMHSIEHKLPPWPFVLVVGNTFFCVHGDRRARFSCIFETIQTWFTACGEEQLDGRWDISSLTI